MTSRRTWRLLPLLAALALFASACLGGDDGGGGEAGGGDGEGGEGGDLSGATVNVLGALIDQDQDRLALAFDQFEEQTGATVSYEGSADFETLVRTRAEGGNPPDIALFPQPGLMADLADQLVPLDFLETDRLQENLVGGLYDLGTVDGNFVGLIYRLSLKSIVWYPVPEFSENGYEQPETIDELLALTEQIREDGNTPWCIGIESGPATGWVITDWIEDILLRTAGPEAYDQWVDGELAFDSQEVQNAGEIFAEIALTENNVLGGTQAILTTPFGDAPTPMFNDPPNCFMHRQASFITGFFPDDVVLGEDVDFFPFPPAEGGGEGNPALIAGDLAAMFNDTPAARALMEFLATPEAGEPFAAEGAFLSPWTNFDSSVYPDEFTRRQGEFIAEAPAARFDASDLMPADVGAGSFWTEMVSWINGELPLEEALSNIEQTFPESDTTDTVEGSESES